MADGTELTGRLADLAESGRRRAAPLSAEHIRAHGDRRLRHRRTALASGGALLAVVLAVGGLSLAEPLWRAAPPASDPGPSVSHVPPTPAPGAEYATELGYVYGAEVRGGTVRVTVEQVREVDGAAVPTGVVHTLALPGRTVVEARRLAGAEPADVPLHRLVDELGEGPRWVFAIDYDDEGRVQSLREAFWLAG